MLYGHFLEACQNRFGEIIRYQNVNELSRKKYFCYFVQNKNIYVIVMHSIQNCMQEFLNDETISIETVQKLKGQCKVIH